MDVGVRESVGDAVGVHVGLGVCTTVTMACTRALCKRESEFQ